MPQTGFESRSHDGVWTTFAEESDYIDALLAEYPSIGEEVIGQGETGLDIRMFKVGTGDKHVFLVAQVHADELSGRDALLSLVRDWTTSTDSDFQNYLEEVTLLIVPTARPDSQTSRNNANDVNLNRDHVQLTQSETRAIQQVITDYEPVLVVDVHEGRNISADYATHKALNPNTETVLAGLSQELELHVQHAIEGEGWTWEPYQGHNITGPEYLHNIGGLRHAVGLLLESMRVSAGGNVVDTARRYQTQVTALNAILGWHALNLQRVASAASSSRRGTAIKPIEVHLPDGTASTWETVYPVPDGYRVTQADAAEIVDVLEVFNAPQPSGDVVRVSHPARWLLHYLLDAQSPQRLTTATRYYDETLRPSVPAVPISGVSGWMCRLGGVTYQAYIPGTPRPAPVGVPTMPPPGAPPTPPVNVLEDPSFETNYWFDLWTGTGSFTVAPSSVSRTGSQSAAISDTAGNMIQFDTVDVEPDDSWRFSVWYQTEGAPNLGRYTGTSLRLRDANNTSNVLGRTETLTQVGDEWTRAVVTVTIPEDVTALNAVLYVSHSEGTLIIDDVALQEVG